MPTPREVMKVVIPVFLGLIFALLGFSIGAPKTQPILTLIFTIISVLFAIISIYETARTSANIQEQTQKKVEAIEAKAEGAPDQTKYAWDIARVKLEAYFDRNLFQVQLIFYVSIGVMSVGFAFIMWGVSHAVSKPESIHSSYLAAISGIITEFIGATFMLIYRSTMAQANQFMSVLERINRVGMAVQILDAIPDANTDLKNKTRAEIATLLLNATSPPLDTKEPS